MTTKPHNLAIVLTATCMLLFTGGCASSKTTGQRQVGKTVESMDAFVQSMNNIQTQIDTMVSAMNAIETAPDRVAAYTTFIKELEQTESLADKVRKRANTMRKHRDAYFATWTSQTAEIADPDLRAVAEQRRAKLHASFEVITQASGLAKTSFESFMQNLYDIQVFIGNDLTDEGLAAVASYRKSATSSAESVKGAISTIVAEVDKVRQSVAPPVAGK